MLSAHHSPTRSSPYAAPLGPTTLNPGQPSTSSTSLTPPGFPHGDKKKLSINTIKSRSSLPNHLTVFAQGSKFNWYREDDLQPAIGAASLPLGKQPRSANISEGQRIRCSFPGPNLTLIVLYHRNSRHSCWPVRVARGRTHFGGERHFTLVCAVSWDVSVAAVNVGIWLAWQIPVLWPFMMTHFTYYPFSANTYTMLTSVFR